jgi:hypothetical protein
MALSLPYLQAGLVQSLEMAAQGLTGDEERSGLEKEGYNTVPYTSLRPVRNTLVNCFCEFWPASAMAPLRKRSPIR